MRIGIDVRYLSHGLVGGIHTYLKSILPELLSIGMNHQFYLYADTKKPFEVQPLPKNAVLRLLPYNNALSSVYNDIFMRRAIERDHLDVIHFAGNYGFGPRNVRCIITLQDEINLLPLHSIIRGHNKHPRTIAMMTYLHFCTREAIRYADQVVTISEYSKRQICRYSTIQPARVLAIPHACPADMKQVTDTHELTEVRERLGLSRPFILAEAFKNPAVLVRAWRRLAPELRAKHEIIFFSRSPEVLPIVHEAIHEGFARMFVRPARSDLRALYTTATAFVFPSWIEGFGIPLLEAMTCGAPIIASDRGAIPEVVANAALLIEAEDDRALAQHLYTLLECTDHRERLRMQGFERAAQFSWSKTAARMLHSYEQLSGSY